MKIIYRLAALLAALVFSFVCRAPILAEGGAASASPQREPLEGLYDYGDIASEKNLRNLDRMGEAGMDLVLCYTSGSAGSSAAELTTYLDRAQKNGLRVIWDFNELAKSPDAPVQAARVVRIVKHHPATWGYYVGDENLPEDAAAVLALSRTIHVVDPGHPRMYVGNYTSRALGPFEDSAEYMGLDVYPIGQSEDSEQMVAEAGTVAQDLRAFNDKRGKRTVIVLQAFDWSTDRHAPTDWRHKRPPSREEMRTMRDLAIQNARPEIILWFSYHHLKKDENLWNDFLWAVTGDRQRSEKKI